MPLKWESIIVTASKFAAVDKACVDDVPCHFSDDVPASILLHSRPMTAIVPQFTSSNISLPLKMMKVLSSVDTFRFTIHLDLEDEPRTPHEPLWDNADVLSFLNKADYVQQLSFMFLAKVTDAVLPAVAALPFLERLNIYECHHISPRAIFSGIVLTATSQKLKGNALIVVATGYARAIRQGSMPASDSLGRDLVAEIDKTLELRRNVNPQFHEAAFCAGAHVLSCCDDAPQLSSGIRSIFNHALSWGIASEDAKIAQWAATVVEVVSDETLLRQGTVMEALLAAGASEKCRARESVLQTLTRFAERGWLGSEQLLELLCICHELLLCKDSEDVALEQIHVVLLTLKSRGKPSFLQKSKAGIDVLTDIARHMFCAMSRQSVGGKAKARIINHGELLMTDDAWREHGAAWKEIAESTVASARRNAYISQRVLHELGEALKLYVDRVEPFDETAPLVQEILQMEDDTAKRRRLDQEFPWRTWWCVLKKKFDNEAAENNASDSLLGGNSLLAGYRRAAVFSGDNFGKCFEASLF